MLKDHVMLKDYDLKCNIVYIDSRLKRIVKSTFLSSFIYLVRSSYTNVDGFYLNFIRDNLSTFSFKSSFS